MSRTNPEPGNASLLPHKTHTNIIPPPPATSSRMNSLADGGPRLPTSIGNAHIMRDDVHQKLRERRLRLLQQLEIVRDKNGTRPPPPSNTPPEETYRRERAPWSDVLDEMKWMATDFVQERVFKEAQRDQVIAALINKRMKAKRTPAAVAIEKFWELYGMQCDGRPSRPEPNALTLDSIASTGNSDVLFPQVEVSLQNLSLQERVIEFQKLSKDNLSNMQPTEPLTSIYFKGDLSPVQYSTLRRIAQLSKYGLGTIVCDSDRADHRTTIAALIAFAASEIGSNGPHLICCSNSQDQVYFRNVVALKCPDFRIVSYDTDVSNGADINSFGPRDVVFASCTSPDAPPIIGNWGLVIYSSADAGFSFPQVTEPPRLGGPILVFAHDASILNSNPSIREPISATLGLPTNQLHLVIASPLLSVKDEIDFPLSEVLVPCLETHEQRSTRRKAKNNHHLLELAAIHSDLKTASAFYPAWSSEPIPPPRRSYSSSCSSLDDVTARNSGKFVQALNLMLSHRCRRSIVIASRRSILDAFTAVASMNLTCFRIDRGTDDSRAISWLRFLDCDFGCVMARPSDLAKVTSKKMNGSIDSVILLECFTSEQDVSLIKSAVKHAVVFRLYTRGTIEQTALDSMSHPGVSKHALAAQIGSTAASSASAGATLLAPSTVPCEFMIVQRSFELNDEEVEISLSQEEQQLFLNGPPVALIDFAADFASGKSKSSAYFATSNPISITRTIASSLGESLQRSTNPVPLYYKDHASKSCYCFQMPPQLQEASKHSTPQDRPRYILSFPESRDNRIASSSDLKVMASSNADTAAQPLRKKQRIDESTGAGDSSSSTNNDIRTDSRKFTDAEDMIIHTVIENFGLNPSLAAEMLNCSRLVRVGSDGVPPPMRTGRDIIERLQITLKEASNITFSFPARLVDEEEQRKFPYFVPGLSLSPTNAKKVAASRFDFWAKVANDDSLSQDTTNGDNDLLEKVATGSERDRERIGPLQLLTKREPPKTE